MTQHPARQRLTVAAAVAVVTLTFSAAASAHARVSPAVSLAGKLQLYSLAVLIALGCGIAALVIAILLTRGVLA